MGIFSQKSYQRLWQRSVAGIHPYIEAGPLAAFFLGISSGLPYAMLAATWSTRLRESGIDRAIITSFTLVLLFYNAKPLWAWVIDSWRLPLLSRLGQRQSWMIVSALLVTIALTTVAFADPVENLKGAYFAAAFLGFAGATYDIIIDAYRIEQLTRPQLGVGSGMSQYGWRVGAAAAGALALLVAETLPWSTAYLACIIFVIPAVATSLILGEPKRHVVAHQIRPLKDIARSVTEPFREFFRRRGAYIIFLFVLVHKIGDTLANLTLRLLFEDMGFSKTEVAAYDVGVGFWASLIGIFVGGFAYSTIGMKKSVLWSLVLMAVSNLSFAGLAMVGHTNLGMAAAISFENFASGFGGVAVVAYFSALCSLRFTATQFALLTAGSSIIGRILTGLSAGQLVNVLGYVDYYLLTTIVALPGVIIFWLMIKLKLADGLNDEGFEKKR